MTRALATGFEPFGDLLRNPSGDVARQLGRDPALRQLGLRVALLPVHRRDAPRRLRDLLERLRPRIVLLTGVAVGRPWITVERVAVNCYRRAGDGGIGRPIRAAGPDGLFSTFPLDSAIRHLSLPGAPARISESAGTFTCNLVFYTALDLAGREPLLAPNRIAFIHLPASPESLPGGDGRPSWPLPSLAKAIRRLAAAETRRLSR